MRRSWRLHGLALLGLVAVACGEGSAPEAATPAATPAAAAPPAGPALRPVTPAAQAAAVSHAPYLRSVLPEGTFAYLRLPSPWAVLGQPTGTAFDAALGSAPYAASVALLRGGLVDLLLEDAPPQTRDLLLLLLGHARSPLELAVVPARDPALPFPDFYASLDTDFTTVDAVNAFLAQLAESQPMIQVAAPVGDAGFGTLLVAGLPLLIGYDASRMRLFLLGSAAPDPQALNSVMRGGGPRTHPMHELEQRLDAGGQGLFAWFAPQPLLEIMERTGQQQQVAALRALGASEVQALALGIGTVEGLNRFRLVLAMPEIGFRTFLPAVSGTLDFAAAGTPRSALLLRLPGPADLASMESALHGMLPPNEAGQVAAAREKLRERLGFGLDELLAAVGSELLLISDAAGQYAALRVRDAAGFERVIQALARHAGARLEEREVGGRRYRHLVLPPLLKTAALEAGAGQDVDPTLRRLLELPGHTYITLEDGYALLASVPQVLIDRGYITARTPLARWLSEVQRMDPAGALLLATARNRGVPRLMYQVNLLLLQALGDLVGRPVDLFALPTATETALPADAAYGLRIDATPTELAIELGYLHNPLEFLSAGSGYEALAVAGIVAAIALPAYQDYTVRSQVQAGYAATAALRLEFARVYLQDKRLLDATEAAALLAVRPASVEAIDYDPASGRITITYTIPQLGDGGELRLTPGFDGTRLAWECAGSLRVKHLPRACLQ